MSKLTKAEKADFYAWSDTITDKKMDNTAPIDIWIEAFLAGVQSAKKHSKKKAKLP